jgi:hypothetical protein
MKFVGSLVVQVGAVLGLLLHSTAQATLVFGGAGNSGGVPVSARAEFNVSAGQLALHLTNTTPHTASAAQLLTGIRFNLSNGSSFITDATLGGATAVSRDVFGTGTYSDGAATSLLNTWQRSLGGNTYQLDFNPNAEFGILGPADGEVTGPNPVAGLYTANGSILGNAGHNPFAARSASFTLFSATITDATTVCGVEFIYNTALSYRLPATPANPPPVLVPEPGTSLFAVGLLGACAMGRPRRMARAR